MNKTTHYKIEFGFGTGKDRDQRALTPRDVECALECIKREAVRLFGAYTLTGTTGGWTNPEGILVTEMGFTLMATVDPKQYKPHALELAVKGFAAYICGALHQEAVAVTVTPVYFNLQFAV